MPPVPCASGEAQKRTFAMPLVMQKLESQAQALVGEIKAFKD